MLAPNNNLPFMASLIAHKADFSLKDLPGIAFIALIISHQRYAFVVDHRYDKLYHVTDMLHQSHL